MTSFRFIFPDDDEEGFEVLEEEAETTALDEDGEEKPTQAKDEEEDEVIWEETED